MTSNCDPEVVQENYLSLELYNQVLAIAQPYLTHDNVYIVE